VNLSTSPKIFAIDFEGNGRDGILEFGSICLDGGRLTDATESFIRDCRREGIFLSRRKIPLECTASAPLLEKFYQHFRAMRCSGILAAHHSATEDSLLRRRWLTPGFVPDWGDPGRSVTSWGPWLDSQLLARRLWPTWPAYSLGKALERLGLGEEWRELGQQFCSPQRRSAHCALYDAIGCALLINRCLRESGKSTLGLLQMLTGQRQLHFAEIP
jgi:DNA polymerase III epsilon subunit-like protein